MTRTVKQRCLRRGVFTIATGKNIYLDMAVALARSFRRWNSEPGIDFYIATDHKPHELPPDLPAETLLPLKSGQFGSGFGPKFYLDQIAPAAQSLFIDADCLCVGPLRPAFDRFAGHAVSVIGRTISEGEWFGDIAAICRRFNVAGMPRFNGGIYYLEPGARCSRVYETARSLLAQYDDIGFRRLRGHPNDEVVISLAMALCGETPIPERGDIMNSLLAAPGGLKIDVLAGYAVLRNPRGHPRRNPWYEQEEMRPQLVHFLGADINSYPYCREIMRLHLVSGRKWPEFLAKLYSNVRCSMPALVAETAKDLLRPVFHAIRGPRKISKAVRF
jgi:hypothetical protein